MAAGLCDESFATLNPNVFQQAEFVGGSFDSDAQGFRVSVRLTRG